MTTTLSSTLTIRSGAEIVSDRKAANAFFARMDRLSLKSLDRIIGEGAVDPKLFEVTRAVKEWSRVHGETVQSRAARAAAVRTINPLVSRDAKQLRPYVAKEMRTEMPPACLHSVSATIVRLHRQEVAAWRRKMRRSLPQYTARVACEANVEFVQWLLRHPTYGPMYEMADPAPQATRRRARAATRILAGQVNPAGMTPERAIQIALGALKDRGGSW